MSRYKKSKSKLVQCKKLRNCDIIEDQEMRHFSKFSACAFPQTSDLRRNISQRFTEPGMKTPYWCHSVVHQYGGNVLSFIFLFKTMRFKGLTSLMRSASPALRTLSRLDLTSSRRINCMSYGLNKKDET